MSTPLDKPQPQSVPRPNGRQIDDWRSAIEAFVNLDFDIWTDVGPKLTCSEAEVFADLFRIVGRDDAARTFLVLHADSDEMSDMHFDLRRDDG